MNVFKTVGLNFIILLLGLCLVEVLFGNWLNPNKLNHLNILKDIKITFDVSHLYDSVSGQAYYRRDQYGLRGRYDAPQNISMLTIGGSTTDQRYISEGATWQDVMAADLKAHGFQMTIVNAGLDGQSTYGHIKNFKWWFSKIPRLRPQYIMCYIGVNDVMKAPDHIYDQLKQSDAFALKILIKERSALYYLFSTLRGVYLASFVHRISHRSIDFEKQEWTVKPLNTNHHQIMQTQLTAYRKRLLKLVHEIKAFGSIPILVTQTCRKYKYNKGRLLGVSDTITFKNNKINGVDYYFMLRLINQTTIAVAQKYNLVCIDLATELQFEDTDFYDFFHTTPSGSKKIGRYLSAKMAKLFRTAHLSPGRNRTCGARMKNNTPVTYKIFKGSHKK